MTRSAVAIAAVALGAVWTQACADVIHVPGDAMFLVEERAREGLVADGNTYYTDGEPVFLLGRRKLTLEGFRRELGAEKHSEVKPAGAFGTER